MSIYPASLMAGVWSLFRIFTAGKGFYLTELTAPELMSPCYQERCIQAWSSGSVVMQKDDFCLPVSPIVVADLLCCKSLVRLQPALTIQGVHTYALHSTNRIESHCHCQSYISLIYFIEDSFR